MSEELVEVRCRGSRRLIGYAPADFRIFDDPVDAEVESAGLNEERDSLIDTLSKYEKVTHTKLAKIFGPVSRQRIEQILKVRKVR
jgi:hypothetical protein